MAELTISVPDALADDVRELSIAVDAVCQRALLDSIAARAACTDPSVQDSTPALTHRSQAVVAHALGRSPAPTSADLLQGLAAEGDFAREVLRVLGVDIDSLAAHVTGLERGAVSADSLDPVVDRAKSRARDLGDTYVGSEHLLLALVEATPTDAVARALREHGVESANVELAVVSMLAGFRFARSSGGLAGKSG